MTRTGYQSERNIHAARAIFCPAQARHGLYRPTFAVLMMGAQRAISSLTNVASACID